MSDDDPPLVDIVLETDEGKITSFRTNTPQGDQTLSSETALLRALEAAGFIVLSEEAINKLLGKD